MKITRKEFLQSTLAIGAGIAGMGLAGCSDDTGGGPDTGGGGTDSGGGGSDTGGGGSDTGGGGTDTGGGATDTGSGQACHDSNITNNHGHSLTVPRADVTAAAEKTYSIKGTAGHDHKITLSATDFGTLGNNKTVTKTSTSGGGHTHDVTVSCA